MTESRKNYLQKTLAIILLRWRWLVIIIALSILILIEFIEHPNISPLEAAFKFEVGAFVFFAVVIGVLLELVLLSDQRVKQALSILSIRHDLSQVFSSAKNIDELAGLILDSVRKIAPVTSMKLLAYEKEPRRILTLHQWPDDSTLRTEDDICEKCFSRQEVLRRTLITCEKQNETGRMDRSRYCLNLKYGEEVVGFLSFSSLQEHPPSKEQAQVLENVASDIAFALLTASQRRKSQLAEMASAAAAERVAIARDLHDTLGQNLGYVHFKLDQILQCDQEPVNASVQAELERLRSLTNESYELIRNTLVILHHPDAHNVNELFRAQALIVAERADFELDIKETGQPISLPPQHLNQLSFVIKEMMRNIERHAQAKHVGVQLNWKPGNLEIIVTDDGKGFDPLSLPTTDGHYGFRIIRDRVASLGGHFEFTSVIDQGMASTITIPLGDSHKKQESG